VNAQTTVRRVDWHPETAWQQYCGFLALTPSEFNDVQERLLSEQLALLAPSPFGQKLLPAGRLGPDELRRRAPLTSYEDYEGLVHPDSEGRLPAGPYVWSHTYYGPGREKWVPYSARAYERLLDNLMACLILSAARFEGDVRIGPGSLLLYNVPERPYLSGHAAFGMADRFGLRGVLSPAESEHMLFSDRIRTGFNLALREQVEFMVSLTSVLVKVGDRFQHRAAASGAGLNGHNGRNGHNGNGHQNGASAVRLNARAVGKVAKARLKSIVLRRPVRPYDLWDFKGILGWGLDTRHLNTLVEGYWGRPAIELYGATEAGIMGVQASGASGIVLSPHSNFFEFIPDSELIRSQTNGPTGPATVLLSEVRPGQTYEVVVTNFYGMPLVRCRLGHLVRVREKAAAGWSAAPEFEYVGRSDQRIDIAGFTRIEEGTVWQALRSAGLPVREWTLRRERKHAGLKLHMYLESFATLNPAESAERIHAALRDHDPLYKSLQDLLDLKPLEVTVLPSGTFERFQEARLRAGCQMPLAVVPKMNADDTLINELLDAAGRPGPRPA